MPVIEYINDRGNLVTRWVKQDEFDAKRSDLPTPMLSLDSINGGQGVQSMLDGKMYDSKSKLRETYKAAGVTEVGNDPARLRPKKAEKPDPKQISDSIDRAFSRAGLGA